MSDVTRKEIEYKIAAAESRNQARAEATLAERAGERAIEAKDRFTSFARAHPLTTLAGGLAVGILVSSLFRGSPTRKAGKAIGERTAALAAIVADVALAYAQQAFEAADEARQPRGRFERWRDSLSESAQSLSEDAADYAARATAAARKTGKSIGSSIRSRTH